MTNKRRHLRSLREYIDALAEIADVHPIDDEVDWNLEIGAVIRRAYELPAPAPLFSAIKGIERGFRVLGAPAGLSHDPARRWARVALSLGLPVDSGPLEIVREWSRLPEQRPLPPRRLPTGPCKQNILTGAGVDLTRLPAPLIHDGDGGRYLNTYGTVVARTPDRTWVNWSITRIMLRDRTTMTGLVLGAQHIGRIHQMWRARGEDMPFALALGTEPGIAMVAGFPARDGVEEAALLGGWFGEPLTVVDCETVDLQVPATSEIVVEGHVSYEEVAQEGPMGEFTGYLRHGERGMCPVYHVTAVTHRDDPILPVVAAGMPPEENHTNWGVGVAASALYELREAELPVIDCYMPHAAACHWLVIRVDTTRGPHPEGTWTELAHRIATTVLSTRVRHMIPKMILVPEDIDPANLEETVWALASRAHPDETLLIRDEPVIPLLGYLTSVERRTAVATKAVFNCLPRDDWAEGMRPSRTDFAGYPRHVRERAVDLWASYGFGTS